MPKRARALVLSGQIRESAKVSIRRSPEAVPTPVRARRGRPQSEGLLWQRKMQSLAWRRSKRQGRRHASGAPMKRG